MNEEQYQSLIETICKTTNTYVPDTFTLSIKYALEERYRNIAKDKVIIFFSGGLESVSMLPLFSGENYAILHLTDTREYCKLYNLKVLEPTFLKIAAHLGALGAVIGLEYAPESEFKYLPEFGYPHLAELALRHNVLLYRPFFLTEKFDIFKKAIDLGLEFHSCDEEWDYCGKCFKCFQLATFYRCYSKREPFPLKEMPIIRYVSEILEYLDGKPDTILTDNWSFKAALDYYIATHRHWLRKGALHALWYRELGNGNHNDNS